MAGQLEYLLLWTLDGTTYRQAVAGGDVVHGGNTWLRDHPQLGVSAAPQGWSETDQIGNRDITLTLTDFWRDRVAAGMASAGSVTIYEGERDAATGILSVNTTGWVGGLTNFKASYGHNPTIQLEVANRLAFDRMADVASTYSQTYQQRLSAGDTAFSRSGAAPAPVGGVDTSGSPGNIDWQWSDSEMGVVQYHAAVRRLGVS